MVHQPRADAATEQPQQSMITVELRKLIYYNKGGHFIAHCDTDMAAEVVATLVIQLSAGHKGEPWL